MYQVGWNTPGYLPVSDDLYQTDSLEEARTYLLDELESWEDADYMTMDECDTVESIDSRYREVRVDLLGQNTQEYYGIITDMHGQDTAVWIREMEDEA